MTLDHVTEQSPLLPNEGVHKKKLLLQATTSILIASCLISISLSFTQVPILYALRLMECEQFYSHIGTGHGNHTEARCDRNEIDSGTAMQVSILGLSTTFCGVINLLFAGWQIKNLGTRTSLILQTAFPALRVAIQAVGVSIGARVGIVIVQSSQIITLIGGMSGYLLVLNTAAGEVVASSERTAMFGMVQGSVMLGTAVGYLLGGIVGDAWGIQYPFEIATVLFLTSSLYAALFIPNIKPSSPKDNQCSSQRSLWIKLMEGLGVLAPKRLRLKDGRRIRHYGITFLALGVFTGVLATGYAPILIQMYSTAAFNFIPSENGYLMAVNSAIRGIFLCFGFPKIIAVGRAWFATTSKCSLPSTLNNETSDLISPDGQGENNPSPVDQPSGQEFDLFFLRWSLVADGIVTASTAFATQSWHIYAAGFMLPLASGSAPASKGVIVEMCSPSERADALQGMTLVENMAMLSTLGLFGFIFTAFSDIGKAYLTFYCNAVVAFVAVAILCFSHLPPPDSELETEDGI